MPWMHASDAVQNDMMSRRLVRGVQDDASVKLINLHHYERRRKAAAAWATRHANAVATTTEDHLVRACCLADGSLAVALLECERGENPAWPPVADAQAYLDAFLRVSEADVTARLRSQRSRAAPGRALPLVSWPDPFAPATRARRLFATSPMSAYEYGKRVR